ncbi:MAG: cell division protein FtsK [Phycisphaerae bacterium]|nr:cell division protein FtsK [Phycisphaerae bacterium]
MSDGTISGRERALLQDLESLVALRSAGEASLASRWSQGSGAAELAHDQAIAMAKKEWSRITDAGWAACVESQKALTDSLAAEMESLRRTMSVELAAFNERTEAVIAAGKREAEEITWLADTVAESAQTKTRLAYEQARRAAEAREATLATLRADADELLRRYRHSTLPSIEEPGERSPRAGAGASGATAGNPGTQAATDEALTLAREACEALTRRVRPIVLRLPLVTTWVALGAGLGVGVAMGVKGEDWHRVIWPFAPVGAGVMGVALGALALWWRRRVPHAARHAAELLAVASRAVAAWQAEAMAQRDREGTEIARRRESDLRRAEGSLALAEEVARKRRTVEQAALQAEHERRLAECRQKHERELQAVRAKEREIRASATAARDAATSEAARARDASLESLREMDRVQRTELRETWRGGLARIAAEVRALSAPAALAAAVPFGRIVVDRATMAGGIPADSSFATDDPASFELPAVLDLRARGSLLVRTSPEERARGLELLRLTMLQAFRTLPAGKVRLTMLDPVGLGESFAGFMHLADYEEGLIGDRIWTEPRHIEQRLTDLTEHMETVIQKYLRNEYRSIHEYNEEAGEIAEPFRFLVIADFPASFSEAAAKRLASIASSGGRCGVYTLIHAPLASESAHRKGVSAAPPHWAPFRELEQASNVLVVKDGKVTWSDADFGRWPLHLERMPDGEALTREIQELGRRAKESTRVEVPFTAVEPEAMWSLDSSQEVRVPLGRAGAKKLQHLLLGRGTAQHALIAGRTGSGKSTLLHVMITAAGLWYSPSELELYLVDFKKGVEFKAYATHALPHARVIAVESEREFGLSVLRRLDAELTRRGALFRDAGVQDLAGFRRKSPGEPMPRVLLVVDEFQEFFVEDDRLAQEASLLLDRLVRQGRAFGMHVVLGSQTLGGAYTLARSTLGQMAVRIALQCAEADSYLIMSEDNAAPRLLSRPGEAIYNDASGLVEGNSPFQIVWLPEQTRDAALARIAAMAQQRGVRTPPPIVFEGNIPADMTRNKGLADAIERGESGPVRLWLGDAVSIKEPTSVVLRRQSGANLLVVGNQESAALATTLAAMLSAAAKRGTRLVVLDGTPADAPEADAIGSAARAIGAKHGGPRAAAAEVATLAAELDRRLADERSDPADVVLFIHGLHRFRDLRRGDDFDFSASADQPAKVLMRLIREGPSVGMHVVVTCDTVSGIERAFERSALRDFESRVLLQMSAADSTHLTDSPVASTLGRHRAVLYQEDAGTFEKFRPYSTPPSGWVEQSAAILAAR